MRRHAKGSPATSFSRRGVGARWLVLASLLPFALILSAAPAQAASPTHPFLENLSQTGFSDPCGATVDSAGDLYVGAYGDDAVKVYDPSGGLVTEFTPSANSEKPCGIAVDSNGDLYVDGWGTDVVRYKPSSFPPTSGTTYEADTSLGGNGTLVPSGATSVAVDPATQNVYVAEGSHVSSFEPDGTPISETIGASIAGASYYGVEVYGKNGNVYVTDAASDKAYILNPSGSQILVEIDGSDSAAGSFTNLDHSYLAVDQSNGHVFVADIRSHGVVDEFDAAGHFVSDISHSFAESEPSDVAVDNSGGPNQGDVYVTSGAGSPGLDNVFAFGGLSYGVPSPEGTTKSAEEITQTSAVLTGVVNPRGVTASDCHFEWGPAANEYTGGTAPCNPDPGAASEGVAVSAEASALTAHATYHYQVVITTGGGTADGGDESFVASALPTVTAGAVSGVHNTEATLNGTVNPQGGTATDCRFQYVSDTAFQNTGFVDLSTGGTASCVPDPGSATSPIAVSAEIGGLSSGSTYRFRLVETTDGGTAVGQDGRFETTGAPLVETTGSPVRTATTARLDSRVDPVNATTTYHFEYGDQGPCGANPCTVTESHPAGSGGEIELVSQQITGLKPATTYHYRIVADNGNSTGPANGEDMALTTFASDAPLSHGHFPGPPESDRAYEQVSIPDSGGNPVNITWALSADGEHVIYSVAGGTPISNGGTFVSKLFAQRTPSGWRSSLLSPERSLTDSGDWTFAPNADFSKFVGYNFGEISGDIWRVSLGGDPTRLFPGAREAASFFATSEDTSRVVTAAAGSFDPDHPAPNGAQLYDVSSGAPHLLSLLPDDGISSCGVELTGSGDFYGMPPYAGTQQHWLSANGSLAFFISRGDTCNGDAQLYVRDIGAAQTKLISGPVVSGPDCSAAFLRSTPQAAFFWTRSRLSADDTAPAGCEGGDNPPDGDVYRYDLDSGTLRCVTCVTSGIDSDVFVSTSGGAPLSTVGVANNGSRVYFISPNRLLPGAATPGIYRVNVASGNLAYVASAASVEGVGDKLGTSSAVSADGLTLVFRSSSSDLNPLGGTDNGGTDQYYRYDDGDGSLLCISCPSDGSLPRAAVNGHTNVYSLDSLTNTATYGGFPLSADGSTVAFTTPSALVSADQNTAGVDQNPASGTDVYEWRDGRILPVTDGLTDWPVNAENAEAPALAGISPSGRDLFFTAAAQYTPDALDGYTRLYDARIGGGIEFPKAPPPCPLEVCQGTPKGAPEEAPPGTAVIRAPGNTRLPTRHKKKHQGKSKKRHHRRGNHDRRTAR